MPVTFHIPGPLREFTSGQTAIRVETTPAILSEALSALWKLHPGLRDRIVTEQGNIREHINIFIGNEDIRYTGGLTSRVHAEADISIVPAISGG